MFLGGVVRGLANVFGGPVGGAVANALLPPGGNATTRGGSDHQVSQADLDFRNQMTRQRIDETVTDFDNNRLMGQTTHNLATRAAENRNTWQTAQNAQEMGHIAQETDQLKLLAQLRQQRDNARRG